MQTGQGSKPTSDRIAHGSLQCWFTSVPRMNENRRCVGLHQAVGIPRSRPSYKVGNSTATSGEMDRWSPRCNRSGLATDVGRIALRRLRRRLQQRRLTVSRNENGHEIGYPSHFSLQADNRRLHNHVLEHSVGTR